MGWPAADQSQRAFGAAAGTPGDRTEQQLQQRLEPCVQRVDRTAGVPVISGLAVLHCSGTGLVTSLNGPSGAAAVIVTMLTGESTTNLRNLSATGYDIPHIGTGSGGSNTILSAQVSGTVENGSGSGSLQLRFRSELNGSAVTLARGSWWQVLKH